MERLPYAYDSLGLLTSQTDCSGHVTRWQYDHWGNVVSIEDAQGHTTRFHYQRINRASRLTAVYWADGNRERFAYDNLGRLVGHQDALERVTRYQLDTRGLPLEQENALGHHLRYRYDRQGRLIELQNENQARYHFGWDALGRLVAEQGFDGRRQEYRYDAAGYLVEALDGCSSDNTPNTANTEESSQPIRTRYQRDVLGRLLSAAHPLALNEVFAFDSAHNLVSTIHRSHHELSHRRKTGCWRCLQRLVRPVGVQPDFRASGCDRLS